MLDNASQRNQQFLRDVFTFADQLLREILEQRCDPAVAFYLPGFPVTNAELISSLSPSPVVPEASDSLRAAWADLLSFQSEEPISEDSPRLLQLLWLYGLDELWVLTLLLAFVQRSDPKYEKVFRVLQGDSGRGGLDTSMAGAFAAYLAIGTPEEARTLTCDSRKRTDLFEVRRDGELVLREHVYLWLCGLNDSALLRQDSLCVYPLPEEESVIRCSEVDRISAVARRQLEEHPEAELVFELQGRPGAGKKHFCRDVAGRLGYRLCVIRPSAFSESDGYGVQDILAKCFFICRVNSCIPYLDLINFKVQDRESLLLIQNIVQEYNLIFIGVSPDTDLTRYLNVSTQKLSLDRLSMMDNLALWQLIGGRYPVGNDVVYQQLAGKYRLLPATICQVFTLAEQKRWERGLEKIDHPLLLSCIRACNQFSGNPLMERLHSPFCWEDLRVKPETKRSMQLACAHLKHRFAAQEYLGNRYPYGTGVCVLMYGPPGTGKTMAAQVMANELQMDLCRVDLSQVSSKYIGETAKNLEKIFREAEQSNVILFFDEADSLFGKRTEVKDSNDKYANQETSYILQRIESYDGMVILATNFARNFDPAFMRRITVSIQFDMPDEATRLLLWQDILQNTPLAADESVLRALSGQFELSGSNIKSAVRNAVFIALMDGRSLCVADIAAAIKIEFEKMGKIVNSSSFGSFFNYIA